MNRNYTIPSTEEILKKLDDPESEDSKNLADFMHKYLEIRSTVQSVVLKKDGQTFTLPLPCCKPE